MQEILLGVPTLVDMELHHHRIKVMEVSLEVNRDLLDRLHRHLLDSSSNQVDFLEACSNPVKTNRVDSLEARQLLPIVMVDLEALLPVNHSQIMEPLHHHRTKVLAVGHLLDNNLDTAVQMILMELEELLILGHHHHLNSKVGMEDHHHPAMILMALAMELLLALEALICMPILGRIPMRVL
ncbi:MAG TPA: hypothetical protein V6D20_06000 [Candidatus Obscuribacterales bacterium]